MEGSRQISLWPVVLFLGCFLAIYVPACAWLGLDDPRWFDLRGHHYPAPWAEVLTSLTVAALFLVPLAWVWHGRMIDILALHLGLNGLIVAGYFFLGESATKIHGAEEAVLSAGEEALLVNAVGFLLLLPVLLGWYLYFSSGRRIPPPLAAPPDVVDRRLRRLILPMMAGLIGMIALPMALTRTVPMLSGSPMEGRVILEQSDVGRPFYNLASSLLPVLASGCFLLGLRRRSFLWKFLNPEMALGLGACLVQYLTSNRLPLAWTLLVFFSLFSMERRLPKAVLPLVLAGFFVAFLGLSGISSLLRGQNSDLLEEGGSLIGAAFSEAFLGDNLADLRDGAWVLGNWNHRPLDGQTYLGGAVALLPSSLFPWKKEAYLGLVALQIVDWPTEEHFGLRLGFFTESFLNFGMAGVAGLAVVIGSLMGFGLRFLHLAARAERPCLARNLRITLFLQFVVTLASSSEGFVSYSILALLALLWIGVDLPWRRPTFAPA